MTTTAREFKVMISPSAVAANLSCLLYLARHQTGSGEELDEVARVFLAGTAGQAVVVDSTAGWLGVNGQPLPSGSPGAGQVNDQLLGHHVGRVEISTGAGADDLVALARTLAPLPGSYGSWEETIAGLVATEGRILLTEGEGATPIVHFMDAVSLDPDDERMVYSAVSFEDQGFDTYGLSPDPVMSSPPSPVAPAPAPAPQEETTRLPELLPTVREAIENGDWSGLLDVLGEILDEESRAGTAAAKVYRLELRRVLSKQEIAQLARLAALGNRRDQAIEVLRRLGADATEILMDLLVESEAMGERRGYYTALTRMADGTEIIIHHLSHRMWYVVRNAAELCGEMRLKKAVPDLARLTDHPDERVRKSVATALGQIGTPEAMEPLARMLKDPSTVVRLTLIGNLDGERARPLAMPLAALLGGDEAPEVIREILRALGRIGTPDALMALRSAAKGEIKRLGRKQRLIAVESLGLAGPGAGPILTTLVQEGDRELAATAKQVLGSQRS